MGFQKIIFRKRITIPLVDLLQFQFQSLFGLSVSYMILHCIPATDCNAVGSEIMHSFNSVLKEHSYNFHSYHCLPFTSVKLFVTATIIKGVLMSGAKN